MTIKPTRPGLKVLDPVTFKALPEDGAEVNDFDAYWLRRIYDGDVVAIKPQAAQSAKIPKEAT